MNKWLLHVFLIVGLSALVFGCGSDKNSPEACLHSVSMNLDSGNYDAVLASPCADAMAKGAAWFGKAGFDIKDVINSLISANTTSTQSDLSLYMTALVPDAPSGTTLSDLDKAKTSYSNVGPETGDTYKDAQFYISLVDTVKSLSLIKITIPNLIGADDGLNTACDDNANNVPDDADATACELIVSSNINSGGSATCSGVNYPVSAPTATTLYYDSSHSNQVVSALTSTINIDTFSGLIITMVTDTNGVTTGCDTTSLTDGYKRLLYQDPVTLQWLGATTSTDICYDYSGNPWPCPILGDNLDLVGSINASLGSAGDSLISSGTGTNSDVGQSITDLQNEACTSPCLAVCSPMTLSCPSTCTAPYNMDYCSSEDIANYIENNLK